jgi:Ni,Fe-hydrogenase III large subunit
MALFPFSSFQVPLEAAQWQPGVRDVHAAADPVREAMLRLAATLRGSRATVLAEAIGGCRTLAELCELRSPLLQAVSADRGELYALRQMMRIDAMVLAAWPHAPVSRPAALG